MRSFVAALILTMVTFAPATGQSVAIVPEVVAGVAGPAGSGWRDAFGGAQLQATLATPRYAASLAFRWIGIARTCKTSLPPSCVVDTPGGYMLLLGGQRTIVGGSVARLRGGIETGVARFENNARTRRETHPVMGATAVLELPIRHLTFRLGGIAEWTDVARFYGGTLGIGVRL